jgi:hypothetical protein
MREGYHDAPSPFKGPLIASASGDRSSPMDPRGRALRERLEPVARA